MSEITPKMFEPLITALSTPEKKDHSKIKDLASNIINQLSTDNKEINEEDKKAIEESVQVLKGLLTDPETLDTSKMLSVVQEMQFAYEILGGRARRDQEAPLPSVDVAALRRGVLAGMAKQGLSTLFDNLTKLSQDYPALKPDVEELTRLLSSPRKQDVEKAYLKFSSIGQIIEKGVPKSTGELAKLKDKIEEENKRNSAKMQSGKPISSKEELQKDLPHVHGEMSSEQAKTLLKSPGNYLWRISSRTKLLTLSTHTTIGDIHQFKDYNLIKVDGGYLAFDPYDHRDPREVNVLLFKTPEDFLKHVNLNNIKLTEVRPK